MTVPTDRAQNTNNKLSNSIHFSEVWTLHPVIHPQKPGRLLWLWMWSIHFLQHNVSPAVFCSDFTLIIPQIHILSQSQAWKMYVHKTRKWASKINGIKVTVVMMMRSLLRFSHHNNHQSHYITGPEKLTTLGYRGNMCLTCIAIQILKKTSNPPSDIESLHNKAQQTLQHTMISTLTNLGTCCTHALNTLSWRLGYPCLCSPPLYSQNWTHPVLVNVWLPE